MCQQQHVLIGVVLSSYSRNKHFSDATLENLCRKLASVNAIAYHFPARLAVQLKCDLSGVPEQCRWQHLSTK